MPLSTGSRVGPFEILAPLGKGGMGEVYRAIDTRLKRQVALKVLPAAVTADPDRLARFRREAEVLASLNHPHIAAVYGLETAGALDAIVMELVDGPTLADRIARAPMPFDEVLAIARQIVDALEAAHERGVIHRDLKPANIKVRDDGTVKVLDFGLAKLADSGIVSGDPSESPTLTAGAMTELGVILGTAAYMSPEQARGRPVDKRTDVWAFGVVLFEMLARRRPFEGEDIAETLALVLKSAPDWSALPADTPLPVVRLVQGCLQKDRRARAGDITVARFVLSADASAPAASASRNTSTPGWRRLVPWIAGSLAAGALAGWLLPDSSGVPATVAHLQMNVAPAEFLSRSMASVRSARTAFAISPGGDSIAFAGDVAGVNHPGAGQLYVRRLDRATATIMPGTEGASGPFYSPDGAWIGFWVGTLTADRRDPTSTLKKVPASGGAPTVIATVPAVPSTAATWGEDDQIYFADADTGISKVSAAGGSPQRVTRASSDVLPFERHLLPHWVTGTNALLLTIQPEHWNWDTTDIAVRDLASGEQRVLVKGAADARYVPTGHVVYMKAGTLMAVPFDPASKQVTGAPVALLENVAQAINMPNTDDESGAGQFAVSPAGTLIYALGGVPSRREHSFVWVDRRGTAQPLPVTPPGSGTPRLSPDGRRLAVGAQVSKTTRTQNVWVLDVLRGAPTRLTVDGGGFPVWSPDGTRVAYGGNGIWARNADGSGAPERLVAPPSYMPFSWSGPANVITYLEQVGDGAKIWAVPLSTDRTPRVLVDSRFPLWQSEISPDGRLLAYVSLESGAPEVYVQPLTGGGRIRVSDSSGFDPLWTSNGRELLYRAWNYDGQRFMSVTIRSMVPFEFDPPRLLFQASTETYDTTAPERSWDISPDGQRFLLAKYIASSDAPVTTMHVVLNWAEELKRLVRK